MFELWYDPAMYGWIPGTVYGTTLGIIGGISGTCASSGKAKSLVFSLLYSYVAIAVLLLITGGIALVCSQPYGIWYGLLLPGFLGVIIIPAIIPNVRTRYKFAENRKMESIDL